jgi:hypothetical protein
MGRVVELVEPPYEDRSVERYVLDLLELYGSLYWNVHSYNHRTVLFNEISDCKAV